MRSGGIYRTLVRAAVGVLVLVLSTSALASSEKVLHSFSGGPDGGTPGSALISDGSGNLYGTTNTGGTYGYGAVVELTWSMRRWQETVLHSFGSGADGALPQTGLVFDNRGNLYGTTAEGGTSGWGIVFELKPTKDGWQEIVLHDFAYGSDGGTPVAGLVLDNLGNLYGTTTLGGHFDQVGCFNGCGTVFKLTPTADGWRHTVIYEFRNDLDGNDPDRRWPLTKRGTYTELLSAAETDKDVFKMVGAAPFLR